MELDFLRLVERPFVVRLRLQNHGLCVGAVRNNSDYGQQHGQNGRCYADHFSGRVVPRCFVVNLKFGHKVLAFIVRQPGCC